MTLRPARLCAALAGLAASLALYGCGSGCGDSPRGQARPETAPSQQGPSGGYSAGSAEAPQVSRFDSAGLGASGTEKTEDAAKDLAPAEKNAGPRSAIKHVALEDLPKVLRASARPSVVMETITGCVDCRVAEPALAQAALDFSDRYDFISVDLTGAGADSSRPVPILLMYSGSKQTSRQIGMPFPRDKKVEGLEDDPSYQGRFSHWLRDALTQGTLKFASR